MKSYETPSIKVVDFKQNEILMAPLGTSSVQAIQKITDTLTLNS